MERGSKFAPNETGLGATKRVEEILRPYSLGDPPPNLRWDGISLSLTAAGECETEDEKRTQKFHDLAEAA
jgi:hypothetical protein